MTHTVFFDVLPKKGFTEAYFGMASGLKPIVEQNPGFISVERFQNLGRPDWFLSYSQWTNEQALGAWRCQYDHHGAQVCGRNLVLEDYRLRVGASLSVDQQTTMSAKPHILALVGNFAGVQDFSESANKQFNTVARLFQGVINQDRGIALIDLDLNEGVDQLNSLNLNDLTSSEGSINSGVFEVQRDYGMFDRAQAPSQFA